VAEFMQIGRAHLLAKDLPVAVRVVPEIL
jgi:hypothetical protein